MQTNSNWTADGVIPYASTSRNRWRLHYSVTAALQRAGYMAVNACQNKQHSTQTQTKASRHDGRQCTDFSNWRNRFTAKKYHLSTAFIALAAHTAQ